jgi:hypothetical protein
MDLARPLNTFLTSDLPAEIRTLRAADHAALAR